jgi:hypothetical protein
MALVLKHKQWLVVVGCLAVGVPASLSFYRPLHVAFYTWKEPHFAVPVAHGERGEGYTGVSMSRPISGPWYTLQKADMPRAVLTRED